MPEFKIRTLIKPRPYQVEAVDWFINRAKGRGIIADDMGLGKTGEAYMILQALGIPNPCVIIAGKNAQIAWLNQARDWGCPKPNIIQGHANTRKMLWAKYKQGFIIITREAFKRDLRAGYAHSNFKMVIVDECHKDANRKVGNYALLKDLSIKAQYMLLISGSIARRGPQSMWGPLNVIAHRVFKSYWQFVSQYCVMEEGIFGSKIVGTQNEQQLQGRLATFMLRRTKAEVRPDMPSKTRDLTSNVIEMSPKQAQLYNQIAEESMAEFESGDIVVTPTILAKIVRLRQILVTPKLLDPGEEYGAGIERVIELLEDASDRHMVIFTPFSAALPIIQSRLEEAGFKREDIILLRGGLSLEELMHRIGEFKKRRGIAICSIRYAESFDLIPATWGIFLGYEWDAWDNLQAEDRIHRGEITEAVNIYYISYSEGIDLELIQPALDVKVNNALAILGNMNKVRLILEQRVQGMHR